MKRGSVNRVHKLIRNVVIIVIGAFLLFLLLDTPAFTRQQAFRRAMREHFLQPQDAEVFFGEDGMISALTRVGDVYVQTRVARYGLAWEHGLWAETEATDGVYIVPLLAYGRMIDSPEVAVLAEGDHAELTLYWDKEPHYLRSMGKQDGWFLFHFVIDSGSADAMPDYYNFVYSQRYFYMDTPNRYPGPYRFLFVSYDENGSELKRVVKDY